MGGRSQGEIEDRSPGHGLRDTGTGVLAHDDMKGVDRCRKNTFCCVSKGRDLGCPKRRVSCFTALYSNWELGNKKEAERTSLCFPDTVASLL